MNKKILVCGAGGFIGGHLVCKLKQEGHYVTGVDLKFPEFLASPADEFYLLDLRSYSNCRSLFDSGSYHEVYQLAADMGGAGFVFTGDHDADIMHNSAQINLNMVDLCTKFNVGKVFYSSSACIYPAYNQIDPDNPKCTEESAYPAEPDSEYGWEKLFSERLYRSYHRNYNLNIRIARFHNIFGPLGTYKGGREKAPAAICRKISDIEGEEGTINIWGDGKQTRSFLYIDECLIGIQKLMESNVTGPVNIGSDEMVSINKLVEMVAEIAKKKITITHTDGPLGVRGRTSDNTLIKKLLNWSPGYPLIEGLKITYNWINDPARIKFL